MLNTRCSTDITLRFFVFNRSKEIGNNNSFNDKLTFFLFIFRLTSMNSCLHYHFFYCLFVLYSNQIQPSPPQNLLFHPTTNSNNNKMYHPLLSSPLYIDFSFRLLAFLLFSFSFQFYPDFPAHDKRS